MDEGVELVPKEARLVAGGLFVRLDTADAKSFKSFSSESWERMEEMLLLIGRVTGLAAACVAPPTARARLAGAAGRVLVDWGGSILGGSGRGLCSPKNEI